MQPLQAQDSAKFPSIPGLVTCLNATRQGDRSRNSGFGLQRFDQGLGLAVRHPHRIGVDPLLDDCGAGSRAAVDHVDRRTPGITGLFQLGDQFLGLLQPAPVGRLPPLRTIRGLVQVVERERPPSSGTWAGYAQWSPHRS